MIHFGTPPVVSPELLHGAAPAAHAITMDNGISWIECEACYTQRRHHDYLTVVHLTAADCHRNLRSLEDELDCHICGQVLAVTEVLLWK